MALDPRKKQKQVERRKAKDKERREEHKRQAKLIIARAKALMAVAPIVSCQMLDDLWEQGMGPVVIVRELPDGSRVVGNFLVDAFCLGVKNVVFMTLTRSEYTDYQNYMDSHFRMRDIDPAYARKLVEASIAYAADLGFPPHPDYREAKLLLESIDTAGCSEQFEFGFEGKPLFVRGPEDDAARTFYIMQILARRCGEGNYHTAMPVGNDPDGDWVER